MIFKNFPPALAARWYTGPRWGNMAAENNFPWSQAFENQHLICGLCGYVAHVQTSYCPACGFERGAFGASPLPCQ